MANVRGSSSGGFAAEGGLSSRQQGELSADPGIDMIELLEEADEKASCADVLFSNSFFSCMWLARCILVESLRRVSWFNRDSPLVLLFRPTGTR